MSIIRLIYKISQAICFRIENQYSKFVFRFLLTCNGVKYGQNVKSVHGVASLNINKSSGDVVIGDCVTFNNYNDAGWFAKCSLWVSESASLIIGANTGLNGVFIYSSNSIEIGRNVRVGGCTRIFDTDFHPLDYLLRRKGRDGTISKPIKIDDDVFIGTNCIIGKGVTIGARSIIAAGSVVVKSIPEDEIWGGNPAKFIRKIKK